LFVIFNNKNNIAITKNNNKKDTKK